MTYKLTVYQKISEEIINTDDVINPEAFVDEAYGNPPHDTMYIVEDLKTGENEVLLYARYEPKQSDISEGMDNSQSRVSDDPLPKEDDNTEANTIPV